MPSRGGIVGRFPRTPLRGRKVKTRALRERFGVVPKGIDLEHPRWRETVRRKDESAADVQLIIPEDQENEESAAVRLLRNQPG